MDNFDFLDGSNRAEQTVFDEDPVAQYFKIRQKIRKESMGSSRASSVSLLSLNKTSFLGEPVATKNEKPIGKLSLDEDLFKKPKTPPVKGKNRDILGFDYLAPTWSPQTPRYFHDDLSSLTPDATASIHHISSDFPLRDKDDILARLENDEKKFIANTSGFSHNSDLTHFSDGKLPGDDQLSIGEFFAQRCEKISDFVQEEEKENSPPKFEEKNTTRVIRDLLSEEDLSGTIICEKLLNRTKNMTIESKINLSDSRHSTPIAAVCQNLTNATPLRRGREWIRRGPLNASTPNQWRQLRQTQIDDLNETSTLETAPTPKQEILEIVKKLKDFPAGTIDCSAMTPLIRDEFPQLLGNFETARMEQTSILSSDGFRVPTEPLSSTVCVSVKQFIPVGIGSQENWLMVRLHAIDGQSVKIVKKDNVFIADDWLSLKGKDVVLPPNTEHFIQISVICKKVMNVVLKMTLEATDIHKNNIMRNSFVLLLSSVSPLVDFQIMQQTINFGTIPENCYDDRTVKLIYNGECNVPIMLKLPEMAPFKFTKKISIDEKFVEWSEKMVQILIGRQILEFDVRFNPIDVGQMEEKGIIEYDTELNIDLKTTGQNISKIKLNGSAAFAKFLCRSDCSPVVFHATKPDIKLTKQFHVKNVGAIPIKISLTVVNDVNNPENQDGRFFNVPKMVAIPLNEAVSFDITFHPQIGENYIRNFLIMRMEPNDKANYDVELIGTLSGSACRTSRTSIKSASSAVSGEVLAVKLSSTDNALSWMATPLQKSVLKTFQIKLKSEAGVTARMSLEPGAFKIMNEKGEAMNKVRKTLKPDVPVSVTVQFKPDSIGLHLNQLAFEFNSKSEPSIVTLTGFGGCPKLRVEDTLLDLHGNRMVKLAHPRSDNFVYSAQFRITNYGNVAGFVSISPVSNVLSVANSLKVYPLQSVIEPNSNVLINLSQHLSLHEYRDILGKQDIRKMATLNVVMGDEPSRQRLRKYLSNKNSNDHLKLIQNFPNEKLINLDGIKESKDFESTFLNSLNSCDVVAVVEKLGTSIDQTVVDFDESCCSFATLSETVIVRQTGTKTMSVRSADTTQRRKSPNSSYLSGKSQDSSRKVQDWLRKVE